MMALASANTDGLHTPRPERHLRLVPPLIETDLIETGPVEEAGRLEVDPIHADPIHAAVSPARTPARRRPVRLTRRGRVVVGALLLLAVLGLLALLAPPTEAARPAGPPRTITVHQGDTLFSIASRAAPGAPPYAVMVVIQRLNHMSGTTVYAGQQLLLPPA